MPVVAAILAAAIQVAVPPVPAVGSLAGCVSDVSGQRVPGPTIVARAAGRQWITVADGNGCYALKHLPPDSYRVTVRLLGFDNVTRDRVVVTAGAVTRLDVTITISGMCECLLLKRTLADHWRDAAAVVHVRVSDLEPEQSTPGFYRHGTTILNILKAPPSGLRHAPLVVLQNQASGSPDPYDVGQEIVAFLTSRGSVSDPGPNAFAIANDDGGIWVHRGGESTSVVFLVRDGRIQRGPTQLPAYDGVPIGRFLDELRALSARR